MNIFLSTLDKSDPILEGLLHFPRKSVALNMVRLWFQRKYKREPALDQ